MNRNQDGTYSESWAVKEILGHRIINEATSESDDDERIPQIEHENIEYLVNFTKNLKF